jgi:hypothetical protein
MLPGWAYRPGYLPPVSSWQRIRTLIYVGEVRGRTSSLLSSQIIDLTSTIEEVLVEDPLWVSLQFTLLVLLVDLMATGPASCDCGDPRMSRFLRDSSYYFTVPLFFPRIVTILPRKLLTIRSLCLFTSCGPIALHTSATARHEPGRRGYQRTQP